MSEISPRDNPWYSAINSRPPPCLNPTREVRFYRKAFSVLFGPLVRVITRSNAWCVMLMWT